MTLKEIVDKCGDLDICETRYARDDYYEMIFYANDRYNLNKIFTDIFGPPIKPTGKIPNIFHEFLTKDYGYIRYDQKLFKKEFGDVTIIAMFWPWRNGRLITVKLARLKDEDAAIVNNTGKVVALTIMRFLRNLF